MFVHNLRWQSSCSQSNHWCSNFETCDLNQRCWRMITNHAIKLPSRMLLSKKKIKNIHNTIKVSKMKIVLSSKSEVISSFDFIICCSAELSSSLSSAIYWFWVFGPHPCLLQGSWSDFSDSLQFWDSVWQVMVSTMFSLFGHSGLPHFSIIVQISTHPK